MKKNFINERDVFALNDNLEASVYTIGPEKSRIVYVDNFYKNPDMVRDLALQIPCTSNPIIMAGAPGYRVDAYYDFSPLSPFFTNIFGSVYGDHMEDKKISPARVEDSIKGLTFCVNVSQSEDLNPIVPHVDDDGGMLYAATVYLNKDDECAGGTSFYTLEGDQLGNPDKTDAWLKKKNKYPYYDNYITDSEEEWELIHLAEMKYNRFVMYPANIYHTGYIKPGMFTGDTWRLVQMFFIFLGGPGTFLPINHTEYEKFLKYGQYGEPK
jgi:hypothetical protein